MSLAYFLDGEEVSLKEFVDGIEEMSHGEIEAGAFQLDVSFQGDYIVADLSDGRNGGEAFWSGEWEIEKVGTKRAVLAAVGALKQVSAFLQNLKATVPTEEEAAVLLFEETS